MTAVQKNSIKICVIGFTVKKFTKNFEFEEPESIIDSKMILDVLFDSLEFSGTAFG